MKRRGRKRQVNGNDIGIAAVFSDGKPCIQVTLIFGAQHPVASVTRYWAMKNINSAQAFVDRCNEPDVTRALVDMQPDIETAKQMNTFLIKHNNPTKAPQWKKYVNRR